MQKDLTLSPEANHDNAKKIFDNLDVSESTRKDYQYRVGLFVDYIRRNNFSRNSYLEYKRYLAGRNDVSTSTKNKFLIVAKIFLRELSRLGVMQSDITQNIKTFKENHKHKKEGLNEEEMQKLVSWLRELPSTPQNTRLRAIIALLTLNGLRQIEIVRLDFKDLDLVAKTAFVLGKGQDDREIVHLHPEAVKAVSEYLKVNKIADGALFVSISNGSRNHRLTTRGLRQIVQKSLKSLDIERCVHGFRHYFATALINSYKGDLLEVSRYTRHKSIQMLEVYNDNIKQKADLPRYYKVFESINFS
ncbi:MAG: integrase [Candidatus Doudnabacteria bacterium RIFCSPLOWO2_01_FULL_44_21]|uniref:Integrase n=1 Tax=Candidatus Doudnabacteria bacterium RIFCSPLOWO2_01_FULL_44_21 TaxID=1817841 RepID=A0A1F5Q219_9BACT|nr:MAG: integrase [Candidatus Doudnabacteria bacterium RIFCSPHIGHO2_02_FULL_43_13b]OGE96229.1 MAG: integrase [Candidatus Doudnabacteria bacterium RIFCSPLOWO2_01_FULL_44_21]